MIYLPLLFLFLGSIANTMAFVKLKNQFRFLCLRESLKLQKNLLQIQNQEMFDRYSQSQTQNILAQLQNLDTSLHYQVTLLKFPKFEPQALSNSSSDVVFKLNNYLVCGAQKAERNSWNPLVIYSINVDKY